MIQEDYISFETAKLLKEKGFDLYKVREWVAKPQDKNTLERDLFPTLEDFIESEDFVELPITSYHYPLITLQMVMKWLREVHRLSIELFVDYGSDDELWWSVDVSKIKKGGLIDTLTGYSSYEQACEEAIRYCLENLI